MSHILTAEEFVTLVLAKLRLKANEKFVLDKGAIDQLFEAAYDWLVRNESKLNFTPNFTFRRDPLYGVTPTFRDAFLSLRERRMVQPDNTKGGYWISLSKELAEDFMKDGALTSDDLDQLVKEVFPKAATAPPK